MYATKNKIDIDEYVKFIALPQEVRAEVYGYHTVTDYIKHHNVTQKQISYWNNDDEVLRQIRTQRIKYFDQKTSEILYAFYKKTVQNADANRVQLWLTKIAGLKDETVVDNKFTIEWAKPPETQNIIEMIEDTNSGEINKLLQDENTN